MSQFFLGTLVAASAVAGLFFLRFWRDTDDRLFAMFALAFWALSANWLGLALVAESEEARTSFYLLRLLAFTLIIVAIVDKNRGGRASRQPTPTGARGDPGPPPPRLAAAGPRPAAREVTPPG
jgi:predicted permease